MVGWLGEEKEKAARSTLIECVAGRTLIDLACDECVAGGRGQGGLSEGRSRGRGVAVRALCVLMC